MTVRCQENELPVLNICDLVVQGGTFGGVQFALESAARGLKVVLIESRTYLGWEMTACLRPWMQMDEIKSSLELPKVIHAIMTPECCRIRRNEIVFNLDQVKITLEDLLLGAGVQILYACRVIDFLEKPEGINGVIIGNKSGRQVIRCKEFRQFLPIEQGSPKGELPRSRGTAKDSPIWRTLEFSGVDLDAMVSLPAPDFLQSGSEMLQIHPGFFDHQWFVAYPMAGRILSCFQTSSEREYASQMMSAQTAQYLLDSVEEFRGAYWVRGSDDSNSDPAGLLVSNFHSKPNAVMSKLSPVTESTGPDDLSIHEPDLFSNTASDFELAPAFDLETTQQFDVLVVGGGTSGVAAALSAAQNGMKTLLVEMNSRVGGTGTVGGVQSYWFGRNTGYSSRMLKIIEEAHRQYHQPLPAGEIPRWNIELKAWTLLKSLREYQVEVMLNSQVIATVMSGRSLRGVIVANDAGVQAVEARVVIDATGDGDIAVFSGAAYSHGSDRNRSTMWYSLAQFTDPGQTRNNFTSMVDVGNIEDYTRAILAGRRRGQNTVDHGTYLAQRESRQILGETVLTLTDMLRQRRYEDVVSLALSNYDVKGHTDSDWLRAGLIPPNLEVEIPMKSLLSRGLDNLLVVGKAISATHDAVPIIRMQRDVENLGAAAGMAAALAVEKNCGLRDLPIRELQARLISGGLLPAEIFPHRIIEHPKDFRQQLTELDAGKPLYAYSDMEMHEVFKGTIPFVEICCAGPAAIPAIQNEYELSRGARRLLLARALAMMGDATGLPDLLKAVAGQLEGERLPERSSAIRNTQLPPDQGAMPDVVYLLYSLGMLRNEKALPVLERVAEMLAQSSIEDFYSQSRGNFYYIDAICFAAERMGSLRCKDLLLNLQKVRYMRHNVCTDPFQVDYVRERVAFLELSMGRAMLRCGMPEGLPVVISFLDDTRSVLREHAYSLLRELTGEKIKLDASEWMTWYLSRAWHLEPRPDDTPTDAQRAWLRE